MFLSGTPFLNHPAELFPMLNMLDPVGFANFYEYAKRYMGAEYIQGHWFFPPGLVTNRAELADRLSRLMIRRTKKDVAIDLPDLTRTIVPMELDNKAAYKKAVRSVREWLKEKGREVLNPAHALTRLNTLRQIVGEGKVKMALELSEDILQDEDKRIVLFCHHKEILASLTAGLKHYGVRIISGDVPQKERLENTNEFLRPDSPIRVMIITVAGAEGIDLYSASDIIFVEREWTPAREEQAEARLHRMGQKNPVTAWYLVARGTVDEKLDRIVSEKRKVFGQVITQDEIVTRIMEEL
jgi:SWI/SNF-related matrix-associated actin-dependent regulator 1 of chromatin subfamily A